MKYLLLIQADAPARLPNSWEIFPGTGHDFRHFLDICLSDLKNARIDGFTCVSLDGVDQEAAIERCEMVGTL